MPKPNAAARSPKRFVWRTTAAWSGLVVALACSDTTSPGENTGLTAPDDSTAPTIVTRGPEAPPLETYQTAFWAVQGRQTTVRINYLAPDVNDSLSGSLQKFLVLTIPPGAQIVPPGNQPLAHGDSLQMTLTLDTVAMEATLQPHGTIFASAVPLQLSIWYVYADLPFEVGAPGSETLGLWYQSEDGEPWEPLVSSLDQRGSALIAELTHFSNYAVAF